MGPTIQDIAEKLGVSMSTVSRSLRQDRLIHPKTRARVIELAMEMGYQGRTRRRPISSKERPTVGVLLASRSLQAARNSPVIARYIEGLTSEADANSIVLSLHTINYGEPGRPTGPTAMPSIIRDHLCNVAILQGEHEQSDVAEIATNMPLVSINWVYPNMNIDSIGCDDVGGIRQIVHKLTDFGHRKMAWVSDGRSSNFYEAREAGFVHGCVQRGLNLEHLRFLRAPGSTQASVILDCIRQGITAFVCGNDWIAVQVAAALEGAGLRVPQDASVSGFDALECQTGRPITSINPQFVEMGRAALRIALLRLQQPAAPAMKVRLQSKFVEGGSIGPASAK
jgi:LacI family transcriptional regulator